MRIIKAAKKTDEFITTCNNCGSILGIMRNDLSNNSMVGDSECKKWTYYCDVCRCMNHLTGELSELFPWFMEDEVHEEISGGNSMRQHEVQR